MCVFVAQMIVYPKKREKNEEKKTKLKAQIKAFNRSHQTTSTTTNELNKKKWNCRTKM